MPTFSNPGAFGVPTPDADRRKMEDALGYQPSWADRALPRVDFNQHGNMPVMSPMATGDNMELTPLQMYERQNPPQVESNGGMAALLEQMRRNTKDRGISFAPPTMAQILMRGPR